MNTVSTASDALLEMSVPTSDEVKFYLADMLDNPDLYKYHEVHGQKVSPKEVDLRDLYSKPGVSVKFGERKNPESLKQVETILGVIRSVLATEGHTMFRGYAHMEDNDTIHLSDTGHESSVSRPGYKVDQATGGVKDAVKALLAKLGVKPSV